MTGINDLNNQNKQNPWYAVRTFNCQELKISDFLRERGSKRFILRHRQTYPISI